MLRHDRFGAASCIVSKGMLRKRRILCAATGSLLALSASGMFNGAQATTFFWDVNGTTLGAGGATAGSPTGAWNLTTANWNAVDDGTGTTQTYVAGSDVVFSAGTDATGTYQVTVTGAQSANSIAVEDGFVDLRGSTTPSLTIGGGGITVTGSARIGGNNTLTSWLLSASQAWTNNSSAASSFFPSSSTNLAGVANTGNIVLTLDGNNAQADATAFRGIISNGTGNTLSIVKNGTGIWNFGNNNSVNTFSGGVTINDGRLDINGNSTGPAGAPTSGPLGTGPLTVNAGILNGRGSTRTIANSVTVGGDFAIGSSTAMIFSGPVNLGNAVRTITTNNTTTVSGAISNSGGGLTKAGASALILTATNGYTGPTTISAGTLQLGDGTTDGTIDSTSGVNNGGVLQYNWVNNHNVSTPITGAGNVHKSGAGVLTFTTGQNYTGLAVISGGTVKLTTGTTHQASGFAVGSAGALATTGSAGVTVLAGSLSQNNGGVVDLRNSVIDSLSIATGLTLDGGTLGFDVGAAVTDKLTLVSGSYSGSGTKVVALTNLGATAGSYDLITGASSISAANFGLAAPTLNGLNASLAAVDTNADTIADVLRLTLAAGVGAPTAFWKTNGAGTFEISNFSLDANGTGAVTSIDANSAVTVSSDSVKTSGVAKAIGLAANQDVRTLTVNDTAAVTLDGAFTLRVVDPGGITINSGAGTVTINTGTVSIGATQNWNNNSSNPLTVSALVAGAGNGMALSGSGEVILAGANIYTGGTTLNSGKLVLNSSTALGTGPLTINGGTLDTTNSTVISANNTQNWNGDFTVAGTSNLDMGTGTVTLGGAGNRTVTVASGTLRVGRMTSATAGLTKTGAGTLAVNPMGTSTLGGPLTVSDGTLAIGGSSFTVTGLSGSGAIVNGGASNGSLIVNNSGSDSFNGILADEGFSLGLRKTGAGTLRLAGSNSYTAATTLDNGTLLLGSASALGATSAIDIGATGSASGSNTTALLADGAFAITGNTIFANGGGGPRILGGATTGSSSFGNAIVVNTGAFQVVQVSGGTLTLSGAISTSTNNRAMTLLNTGIVNVTGAISGQLPVIQSGAGITTLSGANSYTGNTTVTAGTLILGPLAHAPITGEAAPGALLNGGKLVMDYTGGTDPKALLVDDGTIGIKANAANPASGRLRTSLTIANTKAIGWLDDGTSTFQARYTYKGDINLDGAVDSADFSAFVSGYGLTTGAEWANGDFDLTGAGAGKVTTEDFNYLAGNFGAAPIVAAPLPGPSLGTTVPEPMALSGLVMCGALTVRRRNRR